MNQESYLVNTKILSNIRKSVFMLACFAHYLTISSKPKTLALSKQIENFCQKKHNKPNSLQRGHKTRKSENRKKKRKN